MESRVENIDSITYRRQVGSREEIWRTYWTEGWAPASYKIGEKFWIPVKLTGQKTGLFSSIKIWKGKLFQRLGSLIKRSWKRT